MVGEGMHQIYIITWKILEVTFYSSRKSMWDQVLGSKILLIILCKWRDYRGVWMDFYLLTGQNAASHKLHFLLCLVKLSSSSSSSSSSDSSSSESDSEDEVRTKLPESNMFCILHYYCSQHAGGLIEEFNWGVVCFLGG